ncbi:hypothetical protein R3P38DRAFT_3348936 [Favolaschia claudopus]|uniref:Ricin B lectin domain-containing protein n=1 Tax=Favolaschia claudopus TaxID=2862362 RepID=A0AAW0CPM1_9AGAR
MALPLYSGFYTIRNRASLTRIDLQRGESISRSSIFLITRNVLFSLKMRGLIGKKADGTKVIGWTPHQPNDSGYLNQVWEIQPSSKTEGHYTIVNAKTGTYLEVVDGVGAHCKNKTADGQGLDGSQVTCSKAAAGEDTPSYQEWKFIMGPWEYLGSNGIVHAASGLLLDMEGGSSTDGTKIQIHRSTQDIGALKELLWHIEHTGYSKPGTQTAVVPMPADSEAIQNDA